MLYVVGFCAQVFEIAITFSCTTTFIKSNKRLNRVAFLNDTEREREKGEEREVLREGVDAGGWSVCVCRREGKDSQRQKEWE